jgi:cellulose biosynthesis protein BcsQ
MSAEKKRILSFDVGILNLAYCLIEKEGDKFNICSWGIINIVDDRRKCEFNLRTNKQCDKNANFDIYHKDDIDVFGDTKNKCVCSSHKSKVIPTIVPIVSKKTKSKKDLPPTLKCMLCNTDAEYQLSTNGDYRWCDEHYKKNTKSFEKKIVCKKIKVVNCNKEQIQSLSEKLTQKLDKENFLDVDEVLIENQPTFNPTMKTIASILYTYFIIRGIVDKNTSKSKINFVKFISASNKLKVNKKVTNKTIVKTDEKSSANEKRKIYNLTKNLGKEYCKALIEEKDKKILDNYKKIDDLCDCFLQGFQYLFSPIPEVYKKKLEKLET